MTEVANPLKVIWDFIDALNPETLQGNMAFVLLTMDLRGEQDQKDAFTPEADHAALLRQRFSPETRTDISSVGRAIALRGYLDFEFRRRTSDDRWAMMQHMFGGDQPTPGIDAKAHLERIKREREDLLSKLPEWNRLLGTSISDDAFEAYHDQEAIRLAEKVRNNFASAVGSR